MRPRVRKSSPIALESKLRSDGPKSVVANKGYKRYLKAEPTSFGRNRYN